MSVTGGGVEFSHQLSEISIQIAAGGECCQIMWTKQVAFWGGIE